MNTEQMSDHLTHYACSISGFDGPKIQITCEGVEDGHAPITFEVQPFHVRDKLALIFYMQAAHNVSHTWPMLSLPQSDLLNLWTVKTFWAYSTRHPKFLYWLSQLSRNGRIDIRIVRNGREETLTLWAVQDWLL